ncbi:hypothetical protein BD626DRAFT_542039 [Schizophyllum amplum]|uniref:Uncharacterized protein n=1 Tax=Schizophyllum amplum TaxID=97359 RepID=A0A550BT12_9AGAR|nr:hypothetical protein BD626DRAFT_542039 [Auriculariopsis ampla]
MTEYDYDPQALLRYKLKQQSIGRWASDNALHSPANPFAPVPRAPGSALVDADAWTQHRSMTEVMHRSMTEVMETRPSRVPPKRSYTAPTPVVFIPDARAPQNGQRVPQAGQRAYTAQRAPAVHGGGAHEAAAAVYDDPVRPSSAPPPRQNRPAMASRSQSRLRVPHPPAPVYYAAPPAPAYSPVVPAAVRPSDAAVRPSGAAVRPSGAAVRPSGAAVRASGAAVRPSGARSLEKTRNNFASRSTPHNFASRSTPHKLNFASRSTPQLVDAPQLVSGTSWYKPAREGMHRAPQIMYYPAQPKTLGDKKPLALSDKKPLASSDKKPLASSDKKPLAERVKALFGLGKPPRERAQTLRVNTTNLPKQQPVVRHHDRSRDRGYESSCNRGYESSHSRGYESSNGRQHSHSRQHENSRSHHRGHRHASRSRRERPRSR